MILLTGFTAFQDVSSNPTERVCAAVAAALSARVGAEVRPAVLPVVPAAVETLRLTEYTLILATGVARGATALRVETEARNRYRDPESQAIAPIDPARALDDRVYAPPLPPGITRILPGFAVSLGDAESAGDYVCNDTFYRLRRRGLPAYFVHVPSCALSEDARLAAALVEIGARIAAFQPTFHATLRG